MTHTYTPPTVKELTVTIGNGHYYPCTCGRVQVCYNVTRSEAVRLIEQHKQSH
jgi:hypothetical protein